jgi:hypothetical protein
MSYSCWNHCGINREPNHFGACLSHLIRHHVSVNVERGLDVRVPHEFLLHGPTLKKLSGQVLVPSNPLQIEFQFFFRY